MQSVENETILSHLRWRYATKKFDPTRKIPAADWSTLEAALVLAPSSGGLQPWQFIVVTDPEVRQQLRAVGNNQPQITDASHLVVLAYHTKFGESDVDRHVQRMMDVRHVTAESLDGFRTMMMRGATRPTEQLNIWTSRQVYIALGVFLTTAAMLNIDACPMEGFSSADFNRVLKLDERGYSSVVIAAAGYRAADDPYAALAKVRYEPKDVIVHV